MGREERRRALREALEDLRRYRAQFPLERFLGDRDAQRLVLQALYVAIQACLDEAVETCAAEGIEHGDSYREAFTALGTAGLLDAEVAGRMARWASFRNVLAHFYPVVDLERVHASLAELDQLEAFARWMQARDAAAAKP